MAAKDGASKYANLPGIATDQPDVYETSDLPEADQRMRPPHLDADQTENVEILNVTPSEAFKRFSGHASIEGYNLPPPARDFQSWGEWELGGLSAGSKETPLQKYHRLQTELQELLTSLQSIKEGSKPNEQPESLSGDLSLGKAATNLEELAQQVKELNVEQWVENDILKGSKPSIESLSTLEEQIKKVRQAAPVESKKGAPSTSITYELQCRPEQSRMDDLARVNALDQKIKRLESLIGHDDQKLSFLTNLTNDKTLSEAVKLLSTKVSQLDAGHLEQIDGRLTSILQKLTQISKVKNPEDAEKQAQLAQLQELLIKSDQQRAALPIIASRLNALAEVQEQGT